MWNFEPIIEVWKDYVGTGAFLVLFVLGLFYIWRKEERKAVRTLLVWGSVLAAVVFSFPLFRMIFVHLLDAGTYYRILWILPMSVVIAYAGVLVIGETAQEDVKSGEAEDAAGHEQGRAGRAFLRPVGVGVMCAVIVLSGSLVYKSQYISRAENAYHIPQCVVEICDEILPDNVRPETRVMAVFPSELIHFVRQYTCDVRMPYGREMLVAGWSHERELFYLMESEIYDTEWIADKVTGNCARYVILNSNKPKTEPIENYQFVLQKVIGPYEVYRNLQIP